MRKRPTSLALIYLILASVFWTSSCSVKIDPPEGFALEDGGGSNLSTSNGPKNSTDSKNSNVKAPDLSAHGNQGISVEEKNLEGMYHFQFRIATWNWICTDKNGKEEFRIKNGEAQKSYGAAYGWYYKVEKSDDGHYRMHRYMNADGEEFNNENQKTVKLQIDPRSGEIKVDQTFEYGSRLVNTQDTVKMNGAFISENEIKGNYIEFEAVKNSSLKSCIHTGEYTMTREDI